MPNGRKSSRMKPAENGISNFQRYRDERGPLAISTQASRGGRTNRSTTNIGDGFQQRGDSSSQSSHNYSATANGAGPSIGVYGASPPSSSQSIEPDFTFRHPGTTQRQSSTTVTKSMAAQQQRRPAVTSNDPWTEPYQSQQSNRSIASTPDTWAGANLFEDGEASDDDAIDQEEDGNRSEEISMAGGVQTTKNLDREIFERQLIDLVKDKPVLWDHGRGDHMSSVASETAWREIAAEVQREWTDCRKLWNYLRNYFVKNNSGLPPSGSAYEKARDKITWIHFRSMEFLRDRLKPRKTVSNLATRDHRETSPAVEVTPVRVDRQRKRKSDDSVHIMASSLQDTSDRLMSVMANPIQANPVDGDPAVALGDYVVRTLKNTSSENRPSFEARLLRLLAEFKEEDRRSGSS